MANTVLSSSLVWTFLFMASFLGTNFAFSIAESIILGLYPLDNKKSFNFDSLLSLLDISEQILTILNARE